jgi:hypothetical protein
VIALAPQEGHTAGKYLLGAELVGLVWYLAYLRPRLNAGTVGVRRGQTVIELEGSPVPAHGVLEESA